MDELDISILKFLSRNCRMHSTDMAKKLGVATSTIHKRIKNLESEGIIENFTIITDPSKLDLNITTFIGLNIDSSRRINIINKLNNIEDILEIYELLEPYDLFLKVRTFDINSLKNNVLRIINEIDGVHGSNSLITTQRHKEKACNILLK
ncbi:MAG TPA: Lrp/AsnC family transcriptional regulator [Methanosarcinales archaeon]|nr:Lrp/AsnC family transcriptional regulator [Methanosarcinales archaeon]